MCVWICSAELAKLDRFYAKPHSEGGCRKKHRIVSLEHASVDWYCQTVTQVYIQTKSNCWALLSSSLRSCDPSLYKSDIPIAHIARLPLLCVCVCVKRPFAACERVHGTTEGSLSRGTRVCPCGSGSSTMGTIPVPSHPAG